MNKQLHFLWIVAVLALLPSCFYNDPDYYRVEPEADDPPVFSVSINLDTLTDPVVSDSLLVSFECEIENGNFYFADAYLAGSYIFESDSTHGSFWLKNYMAFPGVDSLYMHFYYNTNSNSLADVIGLEAYVASRTYGITFEAGGAR